MQLACGQLKEILLPGLKVVPANEGMLERSAVILVVLQVVHDDFKLICNYATVLYHG